MAYLVNEIQNKVRAELRRKLPFETLPLITNEEFYDICNRVQRDINIRAEVHWERYYQDATADETNYEMAGKILKVVYFYYESSDYADQRYTYIDDVIVLKTAPSAVQLDIRYLRDTGDISGPTDEIDLPDNLMSDFIDLVRTLSMIRFGDMPQERYDAELEAKIPMIKMQLPRRGALPDKGVLRYDPSGERNDFKYVITNNWVSADSVVYDGSNYIFIT